MIKTEPDQIARELKIAPTTDRPRAKPVRDPLDVAPEDRADFVRRARWALGMSQYDFAACIGRSRARVQQYESGEHVPDDVIARIIRVCEEERAKPETATPPPRVVGRPSLRWK